MLDCQSARPSYQSKKGCVAQSQCITTLSFQLLWAKFHAKNSVRSAPASTALIQVSHRSHNARTANHNLHGCGEGNGAQKERTKIYIYITPTLSKMVRNDALGSSCFKNLALLVLKILMLGL